MVLGTLGVLVLLLTLDLFGGCGPGTASAGGPGGGDERSMTFAVGPEDGPAAVLDGIRGARRRVLMEMYLLTAPEAVSALLTARRAGADVRVLLEPMPFGEPDANLPAYAALVAAGVDVRWTTRREGLTHAKVIIVDGRAIITTANLTVSGLGVNREFTVVDTDAVDVRWAEALWTADAVGAEPGTPPARTHLVASPIDARSRLTAALEAARSSIEVEMEELSDSDVVARLLRARERGVIVTVVAPATDTSAATTAALRALGAGAVSVRLLAVPTVHAKAMVIDRRLLYVGSVNFTRASFDDNREVGILLEAPRAAGRIAATIAGDAAAGRPP